MFMDYARCVYFESRYNPARALRVAAGLWVARIKHDVGPLHYSLFRFADTPKSEWPGYVRDKQFYVRVTSKTRSDLHQLIGNKALFYQHCIEHGLATVPVVCMVGGPMHLSAGTITHIENLQQWEHVMDSAPQELFVKPVDGAHGTGAFAIRRRGQHVTFGPPETEGTLEDLYRYIAGTPKEDAGVLVQPRIRPHPKILEISSANGLATIRIVTAMVHDQPKALYACVKLPVGTSITDNFSKGSSGNLVAAIDIDTGILSEGWRSVRSDWPVMRPTASHPGTGNPIKGSMIPQWLKVLELALQAQKSLPQLRSIGWDIAVTDDEVLLLEGNDTYGIEILQVAHQRGLGRELISVIESRSSPSSV